MTAKQSFGARFGILACALSLSLLTACDLPANTSGQSSQPKSTAERPKAAVNEYGQAPENITGIMEGDGKALTQEVKK